MLATRSSGADPIEPDTTLSCPSCRFEGERYRDWAPTFDGGRVAYACPDCADLVAGRARRLTDGGDR
ncbi:hypothetical protein [Natronorarus salvus]|uniref:hypothetical protein n=1 Tax=Natronorarus salvus TaxID=3117733 RepID=UPI002F265A05